MNRFAIARAGSYKEAGELLADKRFALPVVKAAGMDLLDLMKEGLLEPDVLIDVRRVRAEGAKDPVSQSGATIRIEAGATLAQIASSAVIAKAAPAIGQACDNAATPQVRNVATAAGNLLQRPRCWYFRNDQFDCLKKGGPTCYAVEGENKYHAIFGEGPCHIVHPSNLAIGLMIADATVHLTNSKRASLPLADLFHVPDKGVKSEHNLEPGELVTHITLTPVPASGFYAVKEKQSFDWPLVAAAAAVELDGDTISSARVCAGAVAPVPWPLPKVADALKGVKVTDDAALAKACALSTQGARPMTANAYKLQLLPVAVKRAVLRAAGRLPKEAMP